jgi:uncharacterized membrane protein
MILGILAFVGVFVSGYLMAFKLGYIGELKCSVGSCETVNTSRWATFLGLPVAAWGFAFYVGTLVLVLLGISQKYAESRGFSVLFVVLTGWGVLFSGWLTYLELFVIHAICIWCVTSAFIVLLMFVVSLLDLREFQTAN